MLYSEGRFNGGFLCYEFERLIHGGAYFQNFTVFAVGHAEIIKEKEWITNT